MDRENGLRTARVRFLVNLAGDGFAYQPGEEADIDENEARRLISARYAVPAAVRSVETAVAGPVETRAKGKAKK